MNNIEPKIVMESPNPYENPLARSIFDAIYPDSPHVLPGNMEFVLQYLDEVPDGNVEGFRKWMDDGMDY